MTGEDQPILCARESATAVVVVRAFADGSDTGSSRPHVAPVDTSCRGRAPLGQQLPHRISKTGGRGCSATKRPVPAPQPDDARGVTNS